MQSTENRADAATSTAAVIGESSSDIACSYSTSNKTSAETTAFLKHPLPVAQHWHQKQPNSKCIEMGEYVILRDTQGNQKVVKVSRNSVYFGGKKPFPLKLLHKSPYGMIFRYEKKAWRKCGCNACSTKLIDSEEEETQDGFLLYDDNTAQALTASEITSMKRDLSCEELVEKIVENSTSFTNKSSLAQQKYIRKKQKKHLQQFTVLKPTLRDIAETYYKSAPLKIGGLRFDYLSLALTHADIRPSTRVLVIDHSMGLLTAAIAMKLDGSGVLFRVEPKGMTSRILHEIGVPSSLKSIICDIPLSMLNFPSPVKRDGSDVVHAGTEEATNEPVVTNALSYHNDGNIEHPNDEVQSQQEQLLCDQAASEALEDLRNEGVHAFLAVVAGHRLVEDSNSMQNVALHYAEIGDTFLQADGRLVIFCGNMLPLTRCQAYLHSREDYVHVKLEEVFLREHQIRPKASHPMMSGASRLFEGFLLTAIKVDA